ncbi:MAG: hypothetical protein JW913_19030 [Chitinispirillaceae bacterium]|nr:hypothetical protein [Chitinispirillaceae bacterium]
MTIHALKTIIRAAALAVSALAPFLANAAGEPPILTGTIYDEQGRPARNADICLYRINFQTIDAALKHPYPQGATRCRKTDRSGNYDLILPDRDPYLLLARRKSSWVMRMVTPSSEADTVRRQDTLQPTGSLQFQVKAEGQRIHRAVIALTGTPFSFTGDTAGAMNVSDIPAGSYAAIIKSIHRGYRAVRCSLHVRPGKTERFGDTLKIPREHAAYVPEKEVILGAAAPAVPQPQTPFPKADPPRSAPADRPAAPVPPPQKRPLPNAVSQPPIVKAPADTFIGIFDSLTLVGSARDDGSIVSMEWDIGATGRFLRSDEGRIRLPPFKAPVSRLKCCFRAVDNDGISATDTTVVHAGLLWMSISPPKELLGRNGHSLVAFNDELWIIGGNRSDVWSSSNGISWTMLTDAAPFGKLFGHSTTAFKNRLWVIGGKTGPNTFSNAIWNSAAGVQWKRTATMPFDKRLYHAAVVFQGKLWVIGGLTDSENEPIRNDVWSSADGIHWNLVAKNAPFAQRYGHGCTVFNDRLVVLGGFNDAVGKQQSFGDVWQSADGGNWTQTTTAAPFAKEQFHSVLTFDNKLWAIGGYDRENGTDRFNDILFTADAASWTDLTPNLNGGGRFFCAAVPFGNRILISPSNSHKLWVMR